MLWLFDQHPSCCTPADADAVAQLSHKPTAYQVDRAAREVQASQQSAHAHGVLHSSFFATHWSRSNQPHGQQQQTQIQTQQQLAVSSSCAQTSPFASPAQAAGAIVLNRADPAGSQGADTRHNSHDSSSSTAIRISTDSNQPEGHCSCTAGCFSPSSCSCCPSTSCTSLVSGGSTDTAASGSCSSRSTSASVQALSNCLMVVLQPLALGPGVLLLSFLLLSRVEGGWAEAWRVGVASLHVGMRAGQA